MSYNPRGRVVLLVVVILIITFWARPWKRIFVYPFRIKEGKFFVVQSVTWIAALLLSIVRSFDINLIEGSVPVKHASQHIQFLLDGSLSMSADDVAPNRFVNATSLINRIASGNADAGYGLIVFSGLPVIRIPWTEDEKGFATVVQKMRLGDFPPTDNFLGTALGDALLLSIHQFNSLPVSSSRSIVVISDGDSNKGYDPYKVLGLLQEQQIPVYFIALGDDGYEVGKDATGLPVVTSFDTKLMQQFADTTKGGIYRNPDEQDIQELLGSLRANHGDEQVVYVAQKVAINHLISSLLIALYLLLTCFGLRKIWLSHAKE